MPRPSLRLFALAALAALPLLAVASPAVAGEHRLGAGFHYWRAAESLDDSFDIDESGLATLVSYQYYPGGVIGFEVDVEYFDEGFAGANGEVYSPQVYLLVGKGVYAGVGVGSNYSDTFTDSFSDPFLAAKLGLNLALLPHLSLDVNANYRFDDWSELEDASSDTITIGALVRIGF